MATETETETPGFEGRGTTSQGTVSRFVNDHITAVMLLPALLTIFLIFAYPVAYLFWQSVHLDIPGVAAQQFVGIQHYADLFESSQFYNYFKTTLVYSFGSLFLSLTTGLLVALAINHVERSWVRNLYSTVVLFAWAVPLAVIAIVFKFILQGGGFGLLNMLLTDLGVLETGHAWLSDKRIIVWLVTVTDAWARMPFAMIVFLAGLQSIPQHMYDAAKVDGATTFQTFRNITVPYLRPYFAIVALINWMFAFRAFSVIFPMTQGGPGTRTQTLAIWIYKVGMVQIRPGFGSAIAAFLVLITVIVATFYVTVVLERVEEE
jgi:multiple sugar transport system permease protein